MSERFLYSIKIADAPTIDNDYMCDAIVLKLEPIEATERLLSTIIEEPGTPMIVEFEAVDLDAEVVISYGVVGDNINGAYFEMTADSEEFIIETTHEIDEGVLKAVAENRVYFSAL